MKELRQAVSEVVEQTERKQREAEAPTSASQRGRSPRLLGTPRGDGYTSSSHRPFEMSRQQWSPRSSTGWQPSLRPEEAQASAELTARSRLAEALAENNRALDEGPLRRTTERTESTSARDESESRAELEKRMERRLEERFERKLAAQREEDKVRFEWEAQERQRELRVEKETMDRNARRAEEAQNEKWEEIKRQTSNAGLTTRAVTGAVAEVIAAEMKSPQEYNEEQIEQRRAHNVGLEDEKYRLARARVEIERMQPEAEEQRKDVLSANASSTTEIG